MPREGVREVEVFAPSLEIRLKSLNYIGDLLLEHLERFKDGRSILELYDAGQLDTHCHGEIAGKPYCARVSTFDLASHTNKAAMLVRVGEVAKGGGPLAPFIGLEPLERCLMTRGQIEDPELLDVLAGHSGAREVLEPSLFRIFDRKLRSVLHLSAVAIDKLKDEVVEGGSKIVNCLPDEDGNVPWYQEGIRRVLIEAGAKDGKFSGEVRLADGVSDYLFESRYVFACPSYSRASIIKGWLRAIGVH